MVVCQRKKDRQIIISTYLMVQKTNVCLKKIGQQNQHNQIKEQNEAKTPRLETFSGKVSTLSANVNSVLKTFE